MRTTEGEAVAIAPIPSRDEIFRLYGAGELAHELARRHANHGDEDDPFVEECVALHNDGDIDLLRVANEAAFAVPGTHDFFTSLRFFNRAIPKLRTTAQPLMECCRTLIEKAGRDGAANQLKAAFRVWCESNRTEADKVIALGRAGDELARRFLASALQAVGSADLAIEVIRAYDDDRRESGLTALGAISFADGIPAHDAIRVLLPFVSDLGNDRVRMWALRAAFDILKRHYDSALAVELIDAAAEKAGPETLDGLADILFAHHTKLETAPLKTLLRALERVESSHRGTVSTIDMVIPELLGKDIELLVLDLLTALIRDCGLSIEELEATANELCSKNLSREYNLIVRWLLSGNAALCRSAADLVALESKRPFDATALSLNLTPEQQYFLCRKAIGWLFPYPVVCCSIIVSVLRAVRDQTSHNIAELLFDPILVSYAGDAKLYLEAIPASDSAYSAVQSALTKAASFYSALNAVGLIKELQPPEYQREVQRQQARDQAKEIQKQAEAHSVFLSSGAVHRTVILYGRRSLIYVAGYDGSQQAVDMDLQTVSTTWELPSRDTLDPVGLSYMLRVFQVERMR